ncbi:MAG: hypothetical protein LBH59_06985 [Planctomycetaceae bacterium]|nr:hypothetical protein [Planctomycetaceae bacterium]
MFKGEAYRPYRLRYKLKLCNQESILRDLNVPNFPNKTTLKMKHLVNYE